MSAQSHSGRRRHARVFAAMVLLVACGAASGRAQVPKPGMGSSVTPAQRVATNPPVWLPVFQFRSGFWMNLNQFLYLQARLERGLAPSGEARQPAAWAADLSRLTPGERQTWENAVAYYAQNFAENDLPYDSFFIRISDRLSDLSSCPEISGRASTDCQAGLAPALIGILESAAPIYRAHWWPAQNQANDAWIALASAQIRRYAARPAEMLARAYEVSWPAEPIRIEVTMYAGSFGSYTTFDPFRVVISSAAPRNQGAHALAAVLYQSSYVLATEVQQAIIDSCRNQTKPIPRDLWHALVFYTFAEILDRSLPESVAESDAAGVVAPEPTDAQGYFAVRDWEGYRPLLNLYWQPYLDNRTDMSTAIERLVHAL